ncbi:MAG: RDD family protein [Oscillospiraceae bacterium]|nr:RDD family protein [Oscillospiraceae bacterium]
MGFLGIETAKAPAGMRGRRFLAFLIDAAVVIALSFAAYRFTGRPDFFAVQAAMDAAKAAGGQDQALTAAVFTQFNSAYSVLLLIGFCYEALTQLATCGSTLGKLAMGLRTAPQNPARGRALHSLLLCARSALKMLSLYIFQGFPFLMCCLTIFTNGECRTGFDMAVRSATVFREKAGTRA